MFSGPHSTLPDSRSMISLGLTVVGIEVKADIDGTAARRLVGIHSTSFCMLDWLAVS